MKTRTMKIIIGILAVALILVGGLAVLKNVVGLGGPSSSPSLEESRQNALNSGEAMPDTAGEPATDYSMSKSAANEA